eukprot:4003818-Pyramimonas_sp.AAC.1
MLYRTELLDVFVLVQSNITVLIHALHHSTIGAFVLDELTLAKGVFYALDTLAKGVISSDQINFIAMFGLKQ